MRQFLTIFTFMFCISLVSNGQNAKILKQEKGSITFVVDENLPAPHSSYRNDGLDGKQIARFLAQDFQVVRPTEGLVAGSFLSDRFDRTEGDALYHTMVKCFAEHRPLVLSPDMVWIVIAQAFSHHVSEHAEQLRPRLVEHDGRIDLVVRSTENLLTEEADWASIMQDFERQIATNSKGDIAQTISADFTTTGIAERIASQVTLMDAMKQYFEYVVLTFSCGIPHITLLGTPEDWQKVHDKTMALSSYDMQWWTSQLEPILTEFVNAAKGQPNQKFWQDMVMKDKPERLRGDGCSPGKPSELNGWMLRLFPYDRDGKRTAGTVPHTRRMLTEVVRVPFRYVVSHPDGRVDETPMELYAGIVGVKEDTVTCALMPQIGWMARIAEQDDMLVKKWEDMANGKEPYNDLHLRIKEVPEVLKELRDINSLKLTFVGPVVLPQWMEDLQIKKLIIEGGELTSEEAEVLKKRFPNIVLGHFLRDPSKPETADREEGLPLIVVDGKIRSDVNAEEVRTLVESKASRARQLLANRLGLKKRKAIDEIRYLKGKSATAVWGTRGADGVIEITTK